MAFQNVVMPVLRLKHGVTKQVVDPVTVIGNGNRETRRKQNRYERFVWNYPARSLLQADKQALYTFFRGTNMSLDSFLFVDPDYSEFINTPLTFKSGSDWYYTLPGGHPLFNHPSSGLVFKVDGVVKSAAFSIDADGKPIVTVTDSSVSTVVTVTGPVYMTVRLNSPFTWTIAAMETSASQDVVTIADIGDIELIEVFEHA